MLPSKHLRYLLCISLFLSLLLFLSSEVQCAVTKDEIGKECVDVLEECVEGADYLHVEEVIAVQDAEGRKDLILLMGILSGKGTTRLVVLLRKPKSCVIVLDGDGRGIDAEKKSGTGYPDIYTRDTPVRDEKTGAIVSKDVKYFWNGELYEDITFRDRVNKKKD